MTRHTASFGNAYFDQVYQADADPWRFASSSYEKEKYAASLAALPFRRFGRALEVGCSIGIFTGELAKRCDRLLAIDVAAAALSQARENCPAPHVTFASRRVPEQFPQGQFDLIVLSEVLYYLDRMDVALVAARARAALIDRGIVLLVHYLGLTDYPLTGDEAAEGFIAEAGLPVARRERAEAYRIDVLGESQPRRFAVSADDLALP